MCAGVLGDKVFFAGSGGMGSDAVDCFDNTNGAWTNHTMLKRIADPYCRVVGDKAYFIGTSGLYPDSLRNHLLEFYDNISGSWGTDTVPFAIPIEYSEIDVQVHGQELVFLNQSFNPQVWPSYIFRLNTQTHTWTSIQLPDSLAANRLGISGDSAVWVTPSAASVQYLKIGRAHV